MRKLFFILTFLVLFVTVGVAQEAKYEPGAVTASADKAKDRFRVSAAYHDSRIPLTERDDDVIRGFSAEADVRLFKLGKLRGSAAYSFQQLNDVEVYPFYFDGMKIVDLYRNVRTHYVGGQLGLNLGYRVEPFIGYFVGTNKVHEDANRQIVSKVRIGLNATFAENSPFFVKAAIDFSRSYGSPNKMMPPMSPLPPVAGGFVNSVPRLVVVGAGFRF